MEFKGTKGKWKLANNDYGYYTSVRNLDDTRKICVSRVNNMTESNANMLLISKAPEMLDRIEQMNIDLKILLHNMMCEEKINHRVEGYPKVIQQWIEANEQLIKEATEL